ncbi:MAG: hypothetical protein A2283_01405 [Lentisphaerae bacterium RIFOXYA12_FULL_48_11]|nr:MAG: hypothetical protein A2283_01405 [Lentisphaerae bacterium RIFOXYA12_FULL_48_11]
MKNSVCVNASLIIALIMIVTNLSAATYSHDIKTVDEFRVRDGLPNFFEKARAGGTVRIAYLGGSITAAHGWRPKTLAWFKARYPKATISEINAAISGTGSDYGACRINGDVLAQEPDLIFLECRVNGGGGFEQKSVEGIVRQIWKHNPKIDICFVYTVGQWMLKDLQAGKNVWFGDILEKVANSYGISSIDLGVEVAAREKAGTLVFKSDMPIDGKMVFSKDGVHPSDTGHDLYCEIVGRSMVKMEGTGKAGAHAIPMPMDATNWETATLLPINKAVLSEGWTPVDVETDDVYTDDKGRTHGMLRGAVKCNKAGATITVKWNGTTLGMSDIPYGEPRVIEATVDGGTPVTMKREQKEKPRKHSRFWYLPEQPAGEHTAVFTVKHVPEGSWFYAGQILVIGKPIR